jgi:hypothetical protein
MEKTKLNYKKINDKIDKLSWNIMNGTLIIYALEALIYFTLCEIRNYSPSGSNVFIQPDQLMEKFTQILLLTPFGIIFIAILVAAINEGAKTINSIYND